MAPAPAPGPMIVNGITINMAPVRDTTKERRLDRP
jgi:hypothetical protein